MQGAGQEPSHRVCPAEPLRSSHARLNGGKSARSLSAGPTEHTSCHPVVTPTRCQYDAYFHSNISLRGCSFTDCPAFHLDAAGSFGLMHGIILPRAPRAAISLGKKSLIPLQCLVQASEIHQVVQARWFGCTFNRLSIEKHITCLFTLII